MTHPEFDFSDIIAVSDHVTVAMSTIFLAHQWIVKEPFSGSFIAESREHLSSDSSCIKFTRRITTTCQKSFPYATPKNFSIIESHVFYYI